MLATRTPYDGWTTDDLDALAADGIRRELIDGVLVATPAPHPSHQRVAFRLCAALQQICPAHYAVVLGCEIRASQRRSFIPDAAVVRAGSAADRVRPAEVVLAIEIVAPTSVTLDRVRKPVLYAQAGIGSYWRIEPTEDYRLYAYELGRRGAYAMAGEFAGVVRLDKPWPLEVDLAAVRPD